MKKSAKYVLFLTILSLFSIVLNTLDFEKDNYFDSNDDYTIKKDSVNIVIAVNWTGSITRIGGRNNSPNYRVQLREAIKDSIKEIVSKIVDGKAINITYCYFGITRPSSRNIPSPDFKSNYIKIFKTKCSNFNDDDWLGLIDNLSSENRGYFTALTVARELSAILTSPLKSYDENYLLFISDKYFNVGEGQTFVQEMEELREWSNLASRPEYQRIKNIQFASQLVSTFNKSYLFESIHNIDIIPRGQTPEESHFILELFKVSPRIIYNETNFIDYPSEIVYENLSSASDRIPLNMEYKSEFLNQKPYTPEKIIFTIFDSSAHRTVFQEIYSASDLPDELIIPHLNHKSFYLEVRSYYDYHDEEILPSYIEQHRMSILCRPTKAGRLGFIWPVQGALLNFHDFLGIFNGQIASARFWNIILFVTLFLWIAIISLPRIIPPAPEVKFTLKPGE